MTGSPTFSQGSYLINNQRFSEDWDNFLEQITKVYSDIARAINLREIGLFNLTETPDGQQWFNPNNVQSYRGGFREVYVIGAIAPGGTLTFAHGITQFSLLTFTNTWAQVFTNAATFNKRRVPYADAALITNQIQMDQDDTNVRIINGATAPAITSGIVVLEFLKN